MIVPASYHIKLGGYDYILLALSMISILSYITWMFVHWKDIRLADSMMISSLIALLGSLLCYCLATVPAGSNPIGCRAVAALYQFFFLSTLAWTNARAIDVTHTVYHFTLAAKSKKNCMCHALYAIGLPLILTIITYILSEKEESIAAFNRHVYREKYICFLNEVIVIYSLFLGPTYLIILVNIALCIAVMVRVTTSLSIGSSDKHRAKRNAISCIKLSLCFGSGWILLFGAISIPTLWPVLQVFVEMQGVLVVSANVVNWGCIRKCSSGFKSAKLFSRQTSTTSATPMSPNSPTSPKFPTSPTTTRFF